MTYKNVLKNKLVVGLLGTLLVVVACFFVYNILDSFFTLSNVLENRWDGVSVASSFSSGNGTLENPYVISTPEEFVYFKNSVEGLNSSSYADKYYRLSKDIDMGNFEFETIGIFTDEELRIFKGYFDGDGHVIKNVNVVGTIINDFEYYGLFSILDSSNISNLSIENINVKPSDSKVGVIAGGIAGEIRSLTSLKNISIYNSMVDLSSILENENSRIGGFAGKISTDVTISNVFLNTKLSSNYSSGIGKISHTIDSTLSNFVTKIEVDSLIAESIVDFNTSNDSVIENLYVAKVNNNILTLYLDGKEVLLDDVISSFETDINEDLYWSNNNGVLILDKYEDENIFLEEFRPISFAFGNSVIAEHVTGVEGDTAYLNDLVSDLDYYEGLNYTYSNTGVLPTGENQNIYNSNNLVRVHMQYNGQDPDRDSDAWRGYISHTERVSKINYYKYFKVENGYINIELLDNPFADRPNDMGFGGWITNYPGAFIHYDSATHVYYAKIPVNNVSNTISITFHARWMRANIVTSSGTDIDTAVENLDDRGFVLLGYDETPDPNTNYSLLYYFGGTVNRNYRYPSGTYGNNGASVGGTYCRTSGGCRYYRKSDANYVEGREYYELVNGQMVVFDNTIFVPDGTFEFGYSDAGYYRKIDATNGQYFTNVYDTTGKFLPSVSCSSSSGCEYYELIQYKDDGNGNASVTVSGNYYYKYVNRDMNIIVLRRDVSSAFTNSKPCTVTGINNGSYSQYTININSTYIRANEDLRIEYVRLRTNQSKSYSNSYYPSSSANASRHIYGNANNLKIGRGITCYNSYVCANAVIGTNRNDVGSSSNIVSYRLMVESGLYNNMSGVAGGVNTSYDYYVDANIIYGHDFDRATNNNSLLEVYRTAAGSFGGNVYSSTDYDVAIFTNVKSGSFGTAGNNGSSSYTYGIYTGGLNGGRHYAARTSLIEGGDIFNLLGGPLTANGRTNVNDIFINVKGGDIDVIIGGAGLTETYGNRIVNVTGGIINRAVFGGSNGYSGSDGDGTVTAATLVYVGGNAVVGNDSILNSSSYFGEEIGSVFGIGNGKSSSNSIGTARNSMVIINGGHIKRNVYGGGNYGAVGLENGNGSTTTTKIKVLDGIIDGAVYGAGNNNGAGATNVTSSINIDMYGGKVGYIYGGSKAKGVVYGSTDVNVYGGEIVNDVYGGGEGGYSSNSAPGTYVRGNVDVMIGDLNVASDIIINGNVYGGSAYGMVNGATNTTTTAGGNTNVTINKGIITNSVFGGGKGSAAYTPKVLGNVLVTINGGNIGKVFGGNDASGQPGGTDVVNLNGGIIGEAYGGGNATGQNLTDINLLGATITGALFGGSNLSGTVNTSNVEVKSGSVASVYGGNNAGGLADNCTVTVTGGTINGDIYGGGRQAAATTTDVNVSNITAHNIFGGSQSANADDTKVTIDNVVGDKVFGGSNESGTVLNTDVNISGLIASPDGILATSVSRTNGWGSGSTTSVVYRVTIKNLTSTAYSDWKIKLKLLGNYTAESYTISNHPYQMVDDGVVISNITAWNNTLSANGTYSFDVTVNYNYRYDYNNPISFDVFTVDSETISPMPASTYFTSVYGGNNAGGSAANVNVTINGGSIGTVFGGGDKALSTISTITINDGKINDVYGGGNEAGLTTSNVEVIAGTVGNVFGGSNKSGNLTTSNVHIGESSLDLVSVNISNPTITTTTGTYARRAAFTVDLINNTDTNITDWQVKFKLPTDAVLYSSPTYSDFNIVDGVAIVDQVNKNTGGVVSIPANGKYTFSFTIRTNYAAADIVALATVLKPVFVFDSSKINVTNVYGGNNEGGITSNANVVINYGVISDVYGGGNLAQVGKTNVKIKNASITNIYGGGKKAAVSDSTYLDIDDSTMTSNVYGGGDQGSVVNNTEVYVTNTKIGGSLYAGGNGSSATVSGSTSVTVDGNTIIGDENSNAPHAGCVFGGGNAAMTGVSGTTTSSAMVNIVGGYIYGNVYGGANTSVVYGSTYTNIGTEAVANKNLITTDITIEGTVFGGGESNAEGSETYDWKFKSVIGSININIDGTGYTADTFRMFGSIFGSGNASSSEGTSTIYVKKLGSVSDPSQNLSIQRTDLLTIDNSHMELEGIEDRTNEYSDILYSLNQIKELIIKNNSTLLLQRNANMLSSFYSGVDIDGELVPAQVIINDETKEVTRNVDNRLYMLANRNLNIATDEAATSYGKVTGMTFFGMYNDGATGPIYGVYGNDLDYGDEANISLNIFGGSYVLGLHPYNYDHTVDGFYTNLLTDDYSEVITEYIDPTPKDTNFFRWKVGLNAINYTVLLTASKYSSLGTYNLSMLDFAAGDTEFRIIGFNSEGLAESVSLVDPNNVPRVTENDEDANKVLGLALKAETREWTSYGTTEFLSEGRGKLQGTQVYKTDIQQTSPSFMFYLYHAKNITLDGNLGSVMIMLEAAVPINEIEDKVTLVTITVDLSAANYEDGNSYDATITYDKKYEMPSVTAVNITNQSQFTAYYSLFASVEKYEDLYGINNKNYHVLTSSYALPVGTQITMIDYGLDIPQYYYFDVTQDVYDKSIEEFEFHNEVTYKLSDFIKMGSTSPTNTYNDAVNNQLYFDYTNNRAIEEFIFIIDMKETTTTGQHLDNSILFEIRSADNFAVISVLGIRQNQMKFNLYDASNVVLEGIVDPANNYLYYDMDNRFDFETIVAYDQTENRQVIIDTNYESSAMGLNLYFYDSDGSQVSSSLLLGTVLKIDGISNFADGDGVFRVKLSGKVSNLRDSMTLYVDPTLPPGVYTLKFVLFASDDGRHNASIEDSWVKEMQFTVVGNENAIVVNTEDHTKVVLGDEVLNHNKSNINTYNVLYNSVLENANVRVHVLKRDTSSASSTNYYEVDFNTLFKNDLPLVTRRGYSSDFSYERLLEMPVNVDTKFDFELQDQLISGTYKVVFKLYDKNQLIEEDVEYVIVTKVIENG